MNNKQKNVKDKKKTKKVKTQDIPEEKEGEKKKIIFTGNWKADLIALLLTGPALAAFIFLLPLLISQEPLDGVISYVEVFISTTIIGGFIGYYFGTIFHGNEEFLYLENTDNQLVQTKINTNKRLILALLSFFVTSLGIQIYHTILQKNQGQGLIFVMGVTLFLISFVLLFSLVFITEGESYDKLKKFWSFTATQLTWLFFEFEFLTRWWTLIEDLSVFIPRYVVIILLFVIAILIFIFSIFVMDLHENLFKGIITFFKEMRTEDFKINFRGSLTFVAILSIIFMSYTGFSILSFVFIQNEVGKWVIPILGLLLAIVSYIIWYVRNKQ